MAQVYHLRCRHCGAPMKKNPWPYCQPCNLALSYQAMPLVLGMMLLGDPGPQAQRSPDTATPQIVNARWANYPHLRDIMD